ncbi:MAG: ATP-dependent zinc metalloprotease FtsH [Clostridia bacterium]|nr:ATP-dependent zinc metalloprotease FtsH [Clostridia bacterium]
MPLVVYYLIAIGVLLVINFFLIPSLGQDTTEEVPYSYFLNLLNNRDILQAEVTSTSITFAANVDGAVQVMACGRMDDPTLVERMKAAGVVFASPIPHQTSPLLQILLTWVIPFLMFLLIGQLLMRYMTKKMGSGGGDSLFSFGKSNAKVYMEAQTGKVFGDVAGEEEAKAALVEIVDFLHDPLKYKDIGAKMPKGALLVGPPGTGKTLLAKAVAGEAKVPFFSISGSEFVEMFVGMGAARVRDLFKQAQEKAPCIVFIDEIDAVGKKRDAGMIGGNDEREQTLNQLLSEMDGFDSSKGIMVLAATNRPDSLDQALLRPGRFDRRIPVELPDLNGREAILKVHAKDVRISPSVNFHDIALATSGCSGAELANMINEAALLAVKNGRTEVIQKDLEESIETVLAGYQRKNAVISAQEKKVIAYHEIGHALVAASQSHSAPVHKITIVPRTSGALGFTMQVDEDEKHLMAKEEIFEKICTLTAGRAAEEIVFGEITSGASNDIEKATRLARMMVTRLGMTDEFGMTALETIHNVYLGGDTSLACSQDTSAKIDEEVMRIISEAHENAREILTSHLPQLHRLSAYLLEKESITGEEFMQLLKEEDHPADGQVQSILATPEEPETKSPSQVDTDAKDATDSSPSAPDEDHTGEPEGSSGEETGVSQ